MSVWIHVTIIIKIKIFRLLSITNLTATPGKLWF